MLTKSKNLLALSAVFFLSIGAQAPTSQTQTQSIESRNEKNKEKYEILRRDQIDSTSTFAIPFDDSEIEDEEEINRLEEKNTFSLPHSKSK